MFQSETIKVKYNFSFLLPQEIYIDGELDPINLGGHVIMSRNASHTSVGPKLFFNYKQPAPEAILPIPFFKVCKYLRDLRLRLIIHHDLPCYVYAVTF